MNKAQQFYTGLNEALTNKIKSLSPFRAVAHNAVDGKIQIIQIGADTPLDEAFARIEGSRIRAGDEVVVQQMAGGGFVVLGKVQRTSGGAVFFDKNVTMDNAYLAGMNSSGLQTWGISQTGNVTFGNVNASSFNSPQIYQIQGWSPTTLSTTDNVNYSTVRELTFTLPAGTWSLFIIAVGTYKTNGSYVDYRLNINGTPQGVLNIIANNYWVSGTLMGASHNKSGAQSVKLEYKAYSAGNTAEARNHAITVIATRTA